MGRRRGLCGVLLFLSWTAAAAPETPLGPHQPILLFKKNENPQNVMVVYTKTDSRCEFALDDRKPVFDFYWLMDGTKYKPVHSLIKSGIRDRLQLEADAREKKSFAVSITDLDGMKTDLAHPRFTVKAEKHGSRCDVEAFVTMGPSDHDAVVKLDDIYAKAETTLLPPFRRVVSVTLDGVNAKTGRKFSRTFFKR